MRRTLFVTDSVKSMAASKLGDAKVRIVRNEISKLGKLPMQGLEFVASIGTALVLGTAIGLERQLRQHPAGLRTNALVSAGAALFVSLSQLIDHEGDRTRIAGQVVSGIGFLAGGVILREGFNVRGMNTAATMWCTAAIKTAIDIETHYHIQVTCPSDQGGVVRAILMRHVNEEPHMTIQGLATRDAEQVGTSCVTANVYSHERNDRFMNDLVSRVGIEPNVTGISWEKSQ